MNEQALYLDPLCKQLFLHNDIESFDDIWTLDIAPVDEGNVGRGKDGWSTVSILGLKTASGSVRRVVIKRQSNYASRTILHPIAGIPTVVKEFQAIQRYRKKGINTMQPLYCATRRVGQQRQSILITDFLTNYIPLEDLLEQAHKDKTTLSSQTIKEAAAIVKQLHNNKFEHRCLYPKHIFISAGKSTNQAALIDLETTRWHPLQQGVNIRDLSTLARRSSNAHTKDRIRFLRAYLGIDKMDNTAKSIWHKIVRNVDRKTHA